VSDDSDDVAPLRISEVTFDPEAILRALDNNGVDYILIGGLAARLHGSPLTTLDADITPATDPANLDRLVNTLVQIGAQLRVPGLDYGVPIRLAADWFQRMTTITLVTAHGLLDVALRPDAFERGYIDLDADAMALEVFGIPVRIAALEQIIASKRAAGRPKDQHALPYLEELLQQQRNDP
jgi:hypothetical protein